MKIKASAWVGRTLLLIAFGLIGWSMWITVTSVTSEKNPTDQAGGLVNLKLGDYYELTPGRKIVLLRVGRDTTCFFHLVECTGTSCVILERFSLSMKDSGGNFPPEIFLTGYKIELVSFSYTNLNATLKISKL